MSRLRDPVPASNALEQLTRLVQPAGVLADVQRSWADAVGETIAGWARPISEQAGVLTIECDDSMIAHELKMMAPELIEKLRPILRDQVLRELRFRVC